MGDSWCQSITPPCSTPPSVPANPTERLLLGVVVADVRRRGRGGRREGLGRGMRGWGCRGGRHSYLEADEANTLCILNNDTASRRNGTLVEAKS